MSLITRCPACGTMFKVVPDQLRISEGWVRCGHCADVFDASAHLQAQAAGAPRDEPVAPAPVPIAAAASEMPPERAGPESEASESEAFHSSLNTEIDEGLMLDAPDSAQLEEQAQALVEDPRDSPFELRRLDVPDEAERLAFSEDSGDPPTRKDSFFEPEPELHDFSFVRDARRKAFWRGPLVRAGLLLASLALGLVLVLQVAFHDRDRLAATDASLRPWLEAMCEALNCTIAPPRQIDAIAIDSSSFNKLRGEAYRLNFTLKNQAAMPVAMPSLELTLTDAQDTAVVRRVFVPAELGSTTGVIPAAADWSGSLSMAVANGGTARIAGYRLLAFYP
ncbi:MAG TPA: DUF3426 domain-containing protein [Ramlibacter sp.]|nr:DUF3426 domain-containing protein [Ramlibacter sp.]